MAPVMKDIRNNILEKKVSHKSFINTVVPPNCAGSRYGHKMFSIPIESFLKKDVLDAMDEYAIKILQWIKDNRQDLSIEVDLNPKEYLEEIKTDLI